MMVFDLVLFFSFDGFLCMCQGCLKRLILTKRKLVRYVLDVDKVEFDFSQDLECHGFCYVNVGVFCLA
jgi:hypothetical protein